MKRKVVKIVCGIAGLLCLIICLGLKYLPWEEDAAQQYFEDPVHRNAGSEERSDPDEGAEKPYVSPVDFEALYAINENVYAWLFIPGTEISYPLLQHPEDDTFYLHRNVYGEADSNGAIYTEASYNSKDFLDPVTIVYGHNMRNEKMFGTLQNTYSSKEALAEFSEIVVYLPDQELHYTVFAAVPFDNRHILYNYDFSDRRTIRSFFQELLSVNAAEAVFAEKPSVQEDDTILILSTCLKGDRTRRFLVCAKLAQTIPETITK